MSLMVTADHDMYMQTLAQKYCRNMDTSSIQEAGGILQDWISNFRDLIGNIVSSK